jgi:hypothetical protein
MVKWCCCKGRAFLRRTLNHADFAGRELVADELCEELGRCRGEFRGLDHCAVSGSQNSGKRAEDTYDREIPRTDDADNAERHIFHTRFGIRRHRGTLDRL